MGIILYISTGNDGINMVIVSSENEAALIDLSNDEKAVDQILNYLQGNKLTLKYIIFTHSYAKSPRHLNKVKTEDVNLITPVNMKSQFEYKLGDNTLRLMFTEAYNNKNKISIEFENILMAGNTISTTDENPATLTYSDLGHLIETLKKIEDKNYSYIIPAYGGIAPGKDIISKQLKLLEKDYSRHKIVEENSWTVINDDIFVSTGEYFDVNMTLVVSGKEATLIDTGASIEEAIRIKEYMDKENILLKNIILTHGHADHTGNLKLFKQDDTRIFNYYNTVYNQVIKMGDKALTIIHTPGHCNDEHLSVDINDTILIAGDIINTNFDPIDPNLRGNHEKLHTSLLKLKKNNYTIIVPGHGKIAANDTIIREYLRILEYNK